MARPWRLAGALVSLRNGVNHRWPNRDKRSDGTIGNAEHASRDSDHNPHVVVDQMGVVRAFDCDVDGIDAGWLAEQLRLAGAAGDPRLAGGGYVIFNRRITAANFSGWRTYTGSNPHTSHVHVSFSRNRGGFDDTSPWAFLQGGGQTKEDDMGGEYADGEIKWFYDKAKAVGFPKKLGDVWIDSYIWAGQIPAIKAGVAQIAAAVAEGDLDPDVLATRLDTAVREATTRAVVETLLPEVQRIRDALAQDDTSEAKAFVSELLERLRLAA